MLAMTNASAPLRFSLSAPNIGLEVSARLRPVAERWVCEVEVGDHVHTGIGADPGTALRAAVSPLGRAAARALLADPALAGPSVALLEATR
jgi:hypothetical protein